MSESTSTKLEPTMTKVESLVTNLRKKAQVYRCVGIYEKEQELLDLAATIVGLECENDRLRNELANAPRCETCDAMLDCDECQCADESHKERRRLSAENAKLREIIADLEKLLPESERRYSHETVKAISENNAELRKLLLDVWNDACEFDGFWDYVHDDGTMYREDELPHYQERMRELGVDV